MILALPLLLAGALLQLLGRGIGTCTQNDIDPFLTGAVASAPLLLVGAALLRLAHARQRLIDPDAPRTLPGLGAIAVALLASLVALANSGVWVETLVLLGSPCGADYFARGRIEPEHILIGIVYGPAWVLLAGQAAALFYRCLPRSARHAA